MQDKNTRPVQARGAVSDMVGPTTRPMVGWRPRAIHIEDIVFINGATAIPLAPEDSELKVQVLASVLWLLRQAQAEIGRQAVCEQLVAFVKAGAEQDAVMRMLRRWPALMQTNIRIIPVPRLGRQWLEIQLNAVFSRSLGRQGQPPST